MGIYRFSIIPQKMSVVNRNKENKKHTLQKTKCAFGAGNQSRTDDLVITNDVLYQLSHASIAMRLGNYTTKKTLVKRFFKKNKKFFCFFEEDGFLVLTSREKCGILFNVETQ